MSNNILISVIIPIYNVEEYLKKCLDSILSQNLREIEILCVNDGSTDKSLSILKDYERKDNRIKIIDKVNTGYGNSMNVGFDKAKGEYIAIVEPDDYIEKGMFKVLYNIATKYDLDFVKSDFKRFVNIDGKPQFTYVALTNDKRFYGKVINPQEDLEVFSLKMNTWTGIYKREFINSYHIRHNETPGASFQDNGFWFQTFLYATRVYFVSRPFYMNRRDNPNSSVHNKEKVFCINEEYKFIKEILKHDMDKYKRYIAVYQRYKLYNYLFAYYRIDDKYKEEFIQVYRQELLETIEKGEFDRSVFKKNDLKRIDQIINNPEFFYYADKIICLEQELSEVYNSTSYRLGNKIVKFPYMILKKLGIRK